MQAALAPRSHARTFLTHFVVGGLDDDRYVVQPYLSQANGDIVPLDADGAKPKGRRKPLPTIGTLKAVEKMRPASDEIIVATGIRLRNCGVQLWGWRAMGIFVECRQRGVPPSRLPQIPEKPHGLQGPRSAPGVRPNGLSRR